MQFFLFVSDMIIPMVIFAIVYYGIVQKVEVYGAFVAGAKNGLQR